MNPDIYLCGRKIGQLKNGASFSEAVNFINYKLGIDASNLYFTSNGKLISDPTSTITCNIHAEFRCYGGKGGFGSMLRAIGAQIEKTTNREACRDLSGRRLRDINEEKRLKAWLEKQKDREAEAEERKRKKLEKLLTVPKHHFKDAEYESARSDLTEKVSEAVEEGFKKAAAAKESAGPSANKRKANEDSTTAKKKKPALWIDDELSSSVETDDSDDDSDCSVTKPVQEAIKTSESPASSKSPVPENSSSSNTTPEPEMSSATAPDELIKQSSAEEHVVQN